jgi:hypothetical protein
MLAFNPEPRTTSWVPHPRVRGVEGPPGAITTFEVGEEPDHARLSLQARRQLTSAALLCRPVGENVLSGPIQLIREPFQQGSPFGVVTGDRASTHQISHSHFGRPWIHREGHVRGCHALSP